MMNYLAPPKIFETPARISLSSTYFVLFPSEACIVSSWALTTAFPLKNSCAATASSSRAFAFASAIAIFAVASPCAWRIADSFCHSA